MIDVTKAIGAVAASIAAIGGGYTLADKFGWFDRAIAKTGQVVIQIRDCQGWNGSNPFAAEQVKDLIKRDLDPLYQGQYEIQLVPNVVNITYGRDVGYKIEQEVFDAATHAISATEIRKAMGV